MLFSTLSTYFQQIESTSARLAMTEQLAQLFTEAEAVEIDKICYLSLGMLAPKFIGLDLMLAEKMMIRASAQSLGISTETVVEVFKETGDLGLAYQKLKEQKNLSEQLSVNEVYSQLVLIAKDSGFGSQERKLMVMSTLLGSLDSLSGKYVMRMAVGKLRLGFSDMTILDALSWMEKGDKSLRNELEFAYNVRADIGQVAQIFKKDGLEAISKIIPVPGTPIRPARATPLTDPEDILEKMSGRRCAVEPKFDGFRVQIHLDRSRDSQNESEGSLFSQEKTCFVKIFSRNLDDTTAMFPDLVEAARNLSCESVILDGEAVAVDPDSFEVLPFQETVKRKRKYGIAETARQLPLWAYVFDVIYLDGVSLLTFPLHERREKLVALFTHNLQSQALKLADQTIVEKVEDLNTYFKEMAEQNLEGLMAKKLDAPYRAGARDFTWVKYKVGMQADMADTVDAVVMGYFKGQGKWAQFGLGKVLVGIRDSEKIISLSKLGSGFSETSIVEMRERCDNLKIEKRPDEYSVDKTLVPDVWVEPGLVIEIRADSVSRSPLYQTGYSLRFPRFIKFRDDKGVEDATSLVELQTIAKMF